MEKEQVDIEKYKVLIFEPSGIHDDFRITNAIMMSVRDKVKSVYAETINEIVQKGIKLPCKDIEGLLSYEKGYVHHLFATKVNEEIPKRKRFVINTEPYFDKGVPGTLDEFKTMYNLFSKSGIPIVFFNTIGNGASED